MFSFYRYQVAASAPTKWLFLIEVSQLLHTNHSDEEMVNSRVLCTRVCERGEIYNTKIA